jgi:TPP-dependent 2-oxoacid decarboxylase
VARMLGRENLLSREEVTRLQDLRGAYGIKAPAPICAETAEDESCQVVQAPAGAGRRLVPELVRQVALANGEGEIRLTYRELSALIEEAIKSIR